MKLNLSAIARDIYPFFKYNQTTTMIIDNIKSGGLTVNYNAISGLKIRLHLTNFEIIETKSVLDSGL
jgi:hypothetical protein